MQAAARQDATLALMKELPPLLRKLHTDPAQARRRREMAWVGRAWVLPPPLWAAARSASHGRSLQALLQAWLVQRCPELTHLKNLPLPNTPAKQAAALVGLIPEMKLEVYSLKRQEKGFASLAASVKDVFLKHADAQVRAATGS